MADMPKDLPPRAYREQTRHGKTVYVVRREHHGKRIRLPDEPFTNEWWAAYRQAMETGSVDGQTGRKQPARYQTLEWLIDQYRHSSDWATLAPSTRRQRDNIFLKIIESAGTANITEIDKSVIERGKERRMATPFAAKNYLKTVRALFRWAVASGHLKTNPADGVEARTPKNHTGFHAWSEAEIAAYEDRWPRGTRERLAFDVLLYTGLRRGDACMLGRQHIRDGVLTIRMEKTGDEVSIPVLSELAASIEAGPTGDLALIATTSGRPFKKESFGTWFRIACDEAGCKGSAHGLRKAAANRLAEGGATTHQLMAWFGWRKADMAIEYTRKADRKKLAREAATLFTERTPLPETPRPYPKNKRGESNT